jgi:hypothetical protein
VTNFESCLADRAYRLFVKAMEAGTATDAQRFVWVGPCPDLRVFCEQAATWPYECDEATIRRVNAAIVQRLEDWKDEQRRSERVRV